MNDNVYGDKVSGDKIGGDKVLGDKIVQYLSPVGPTVSLDDALEQLAQLPLDDVPDPQPLPPNSRMPYSANPKFTGREDDFKKLAETLKGEGGAKVINQAITGMGGVGKTQLAAEFAHRYGRYFLGGVYWLSFADPKAIPAEIAACGRRMGFDRLSLEGIPLAEQVEKVVGEWEKEIPRLLIFDNCEQEGLFEEYRPKSGSVRVLVTSRRGRWSPGFGLTTLALGQLSREESSQLLQHFWPPLTNGESGVIAELLGDLPLALHLAGSYLSFYEGVVSATELLAELEKEGPFHEALSGEIEGHTPTRHERNVARTFELSYRQLDDQELAHRILVHLVHLAPGEPVHDSLLKATFGVEGERPNDKDFLVARQQLVKLGLVMVDEETVRLHRLLRLYVARILSREQLSETQATVEQGIIKESARLNSNRYPAPLLVWQNHLRNVTDVALNREDELGAGLADNLGFHLFMVAEFTEARIYKEKSLAIRRKNFGPDHPKTAKSLDGLGLVLIRTGNLTSARECFEQALEIIESTYGPDHIKTAGILNNLGLLLDSIDESFKAREYLERALVIREKILGPEHTYTAWSLESLGVLLLNIGDLKEARQYLERAVKIQEKVLDTDHPHIARSMNGLGRLLLRQGDYKEAQPYLERALAIREKVYGPDHPDTGWSLNNWGFLLQKMGDFDGAKLHYERALKIFEAKLGLEHPNTQRVRKNIGSLSSKF